MGLAIRRIESIGWLALVFCVAILLYPLSLNVATMRSDLTRTNAAIVQAQRDISYLEAEYRARASQQRLAELNNLYFGYEAPTARQFLDGETALASLGGASSAVPVMVSVNLDGVVPAGLIGSTVPSAADAAEAARRKAAAAAPPPDPDPVSPSASSPASGDAAPPLRSAAAAARQRTERIASLEDRLLSPATAAPITARAAAEGGQ